MISNRSDCCLHNQKHTSKKTSAIDRKTVKTLRQYKHMHMLLAVMLCICCPSALSKKERDVLLRKGKMEMRKDKRQLPQKLLKLCISKVVC